MAGEQIPLLPIGLVSKCRERFHDREVSQTEPEGKITVIPLGEAWGETTRNTGMCGRLPGKQAGPCAFVGAPNPEELVKHRVKTAFLMPYTSWL